MIKNIFSDLVFLCLFFWYLYQNRRKKIPSFLIALVMLVAIIFKIVIMSLEYLKNFPDLSIHVILLHWVEISLRD